MCFTRKPFLELVYKSQCCVFIVCIRSVCIDGFGYLVLEPPSILYLSLSESWRAGAYPSFLRPRGRVYPWTVRQSAAGPVMEHLRLNGSLVFTDTWHYTRIQNITTSE